MAEKKSSKEKKIINLNKKRNAITAKKVFRWLRIPLVILVVAAALFLSARLMGNVAVSNITDSIRQVKTVFTKSKGYPYSLEALNLRSAVPMGGGPLVVYDNSTLVMNAVADKMFTMKLEYADSKAVSRNGRAVIFSPSSNEVILQSKTEKLGSITEKNPVTVAAIAQNGGFATSHAADENQSILSVYNNRFKKIFQWNCSQEFITDISLSNNGKKVAIAASGVENAEIYTRILIFDVNSSEPVADIKYSGTMFLRVIYTASNKVIAVGDNKTVVHNKNGEVIDEHVYSDDSLIAVCADDNGNTTVCYEEFGGSKTGIVRYSDRGKKTCSVVIDGLPDCVAAHSGRIAVASGNEITVYSSRGEEVKIIKTESPVVRIFICSGTVYTVEGGSIHKY